jgi:hypothetical protein
MWRLEYGKCGKKKAVANGHRQHNETNSIRDLGLFTFDLYSFDASARCLVAILFERFWNIAALYIET